MESASHGESNVHIPVKRDTNARRGEARDAVRGEARDAVRGEARDRVMSEVRDAVRGEARDNVRGEVRDNVGSEVRDETSDAVRGEVSSLKWTEKEYRKLDASYERGRTLWDMALEHNTNVATIFHHTKVLAMKLLKDGCVTMTEIADLYRLDLEELKRLEVVDDFASAMANVHEKNQKIQHHLYTVEHHLQQIRKETAELTRTALNAMAELSKYYGLEIPR